MRLVKTILFALALVASITATADAPMPEQGPKGKWGYVAADGSMTVNYKYDEAGYFSNGLALVKKGDKLGMVNEQGKEVIPVKYDIIETHNPQVFRVATGGKHKDGVVFDEKYGFIDRNGKELLKPEYDEIGYFNRGIAYVKKGANYGFITDDIKVVIPCKYAAVGSFNSNGVTWVNSGGKFAKGSSKVEGGKFGILDREGKVVVPVKYKALGYFSKYSGKPSEESLKEMHFNDRTVHNETPSHTLWTRTRINRNMSVIPDSTPGYYGSGNEKGSNNGVFSLNGDVIIKEGKYYNASFPTEGLAPVSDKKDMWNFLNVATGKLLWKKYIYDVWAFEDGAAVVKRTKNGGQELIDAQGNTLSSTYHTIFPKKDGLYIVKSSEADKKYFRYGAIDASGKEVISATQTFLYPPSHGYLACSDGNRCGYRNLQGNWVYDGYDSAYSYNNGFAVVKTADGWGLIDDGGKQAVKCRWQNSITKDVGKTGLMFVSDEEGENPGFMLLNAREDKLVSTDKYKWVRTFGSDFEEAALVGDSNTMVGVLTKDGKLVIPAIFSPSQARAAYSKYLSRSEPSWTDYDSFCIKLYSNPKRNKGKLSSKIESTLWDY